MRAPPIAAARRLSPNGLVSYQVFVRTSRKRKIECEAPCRAGRWAVPHTRQPVLRGFCGTMPYPGALGEVSRSLLFLLKFAHSL